MSHLPVGWTVSNKDGAKAGPARRSSTDLDGDESGSEDINQGLDIAPDSPGWEDVEADETEDMNVKCLLCEQVFPHSMSMLEHCSSTHQIDLLAVVKQHSLDFYGTIKLVNYIRSSAKEGATTIDTGSPESWQDDKYMQPVLEDDALLFSLDELVEDATSEQNGKVPDYDDLEAARRALEQKTELEGLPE